MRKRKLRRINAKSLNISVDFINKKSCLYEDGIEIGYYIFEVDKKIKDVHISDFDIQVPYRDKGYGNYLARSMIALAKLYHLKSISLTDGSTLEGFWQRLGFKWSRGRRLWVLKL